MKSLAPPNKNLYQILIPSIIAVLSLAGLIFFSFLGFQSATAQISLSDVRPNEDQFTPPDNGQPATTPTPPDNEQPAATPTSPDNEQPEDFTTSPDREQPGDFTTSPDREQPDHLNDFRNRSNPSLSVGYIVLITVCASLLCFSVGFIIYNFRRYDFFRNHDKLTIYILASLLASIIASATLVFVLNTLLPSNDFRPETSSAKDEVSLDLENTVTSNNIDLATYDTDLTITSGGAYTISGKSTHSLIINAPDQSVELILNNTEIATTNTAAIVGLAAAQITISTAKGSINNLTDSGNSSYDGCIFSNAELIFDGEGILNVKGQQNEGEGIATENNDITINSGTITVESVDDGLNAGGNGGTITINGGVLYVNADGDGIDSNQNVIINGGTIFTIGSDTGGDAGIDTDDGYVINGGTVIALGSDMLEKPLSSSKQQSLTYSLNSKIAKDVIVSIIKNDSTVISFSAPKSFRTMVISTDNINAKDSYSVYTNGSHTGVLTYGIYDGGSYTKGEKLL